MNKYFNSEFRNKLFNYLRPGLYRAHPHLNIKNIPTQRWKMLMTMRDLRMWVEENAPFSSRIEKQQKELHHIIREINYLTFHCIIYLTYSIFKGWLSIFRRYILVLFLGC